MISVYVYIYIYMVCILSSDFLKTRITKLNDKHIFKASDSQTPQHKTSDPAHLHHWQERRRAGMSSEQGAGRRALRVVKAPRCRCRGTNPNPAQGTNVPQGAATKREKERDREARKIDLRGKGGPWREASQSQLGRSASTSGGCGPRGGGYLLPAPPPPPTQKPELVPPGITVCPLRLTSGGGAGTPKLDTWPEPLMAFPFGSQKRKTGSDVNF